MGGKLYKLNKLYSYVVSSIANALLTDYTGKEKKIKKGSAEAPP